MAARAAAQDSRRHSKTKKKRQREIEDDEDEDESVEENEEEKSSPSHSDIKKSAGQSRKTKAVCKQLEAEAMTQKQGISLYKQG